MFPTASSSSSSLAGLAAAFGKRKMFSFLFIHYTAHIATMYRLLLGRRETRNGGFDDMHFLSII
jgi:hypothetical protein